jgi:hypothetical protein
MAWMGWMGWMDGWADGMRWVALWHRAGILPSVMREPSAASALFCPANLLDWRNTRVLTATERVETFLAERTH